MIINSFSSDHSGAARAPSDLALPFPILGTISNLKAKMSPRVEDITTVQQINVELVPVPRGTGFRVSADTIMDRMVRLNTLVASGTVRPSLDIVDQFVFSTESVVITAGFSSIEWSKALGAGDGSNPRPKQAINLPYGVIEPFSALVSYEGKALSTGTHVKVKRFVGAADATSEDFSIHLQNVVLRE